VHNVIRPGSTIRRPIFPYRVGETLNLSCKPLSAFCSHIPSIWLIDPTSCAGDAAARA